MKSSRRPDITAPASPDKPALLSVNKLRTSFSTDEGRVVAVDDVSFSLNQGESLGVVGESGSGKTVTALSVLRLIQAPPGKIESGTAWFDNFDLLTMPDSRLRKIRGNDIAIIFQDPMTSLNPLMTIGDQITESLIEHKGMNKLDAWKKGIELLKMVGIPLAEERMKAYPFQMSGGMRQRIMIGMALGCEPKILIADEPTTALDVTIQAQILDLIRDLQSKTGMALWLITHDLGVVAETCERVIVMYAGMIMEEAPVEEIFNNPMHPYTHGLLHCLPRVEKKVERLTPIPGQPPNLASLPPGCPFVDRCDRAKETKYGETHCRNYRPDEITAEGNHRVRCWLYSED